MDDFPGLLARDFGFKPQGKSAPMAPSRNTNTNTNTFSSVNFGLGSSASAHSRSSSASNKSAPIFDDHDHDRDDQNAKSSSLPVFDKPVYDDDIFDGLPGLKSSSVGPQSAKFDDVFTSIGTASSPKRRAQNNSSPFDDLLENLGKKETESRTETAKADKDSAAFDDLLPGFVAVAPLVFPGVFDDMDSFDNLGKSVPPVSHGVNRRGNDRSPLRTGPSMGGTFSTSSKEPVDKYPVDEAEGQSQRNMPNDDFLESHETLFDMPSVGQNVSSPSYVNASTNEANSPPRSEDISESPDDVWLTVSEVPLFTQPTSAPPPSRPPRPLPPRISKSETARATRSSVASQMDELEDFAMGRTQSNVSEHADVLYGEDVDANASSAAASAAAMKEAMDKAEAKFRQMREREYLKAARSRETGQLDKDMQEAQQKELKERQERLDRERQQREREEEGKEQRRLEKEREREEKEREQRRLERERERAREIEREREKARQAVERATREARERAAAEARLKAERVAVEKVAAEARERAERAAVQRAQAEARERAAAEARERAEKAAAEARERASAETRERAAVARAEADARQRAERAAVERAAAEARERAAADARERAAAAARANQQRNENDLESFFSSRAAVRQGLGLPLRLASMDPFFDTQNKGGSEAARRTSVVATSSMKKASSTANIVDDLSSIFGATGTSGEFPEVEGETEERRRARLERHQRTQERAAKALAEKNQRDLQVQREQAERHRISETLDVEIKRWAAGKEGNLRALLSTMQYVLWPECGWQPVSLTDLITAAAVKKAYRKATLCIHPDKVQQKGANLEQKYIARRFSHVEIGSMEQVQF
ncbi:hypothetical protein GH714_024139 [Hevea brasiliensis]|uniref:J domain-containing protein n=1 Tax=Hevea brasiliensis TaxID=3981 RepID=A0A6A6KJA3_HEVBR|nr:hypothetical protein GH714_024139 [Hevea brasiliensis]